MNTIKSLANSLDMAPSAIRYYEKHGLINFKRDDNGYRIFNESDVQLLKLIKIMKYAEYSLQEIKSVINMVTDNCEEMTSQVIINKQKEIEAKIENYKKILELSDFLLPNASKFSDQESQEFNHIINTVFDKIKENK